MLEKDQELQQVVKLKLEDSPFHKFCKVVIYKFVFFWLLFHAKFDCNYIQSCVPYIYCELWLKGLCVRERESVCEDSSKWSQKTSCGCLTTKLPTKWSMCFAQDWNVKSLYRWRQLCLASISRVRPSRETLVRHSVLSICTAWYTLSVPSLYIPLLPKNMKESFWEKTLAKTLDSKKLFYQQFSTHLFVEFLNLLPLHFHTIEPKHLPHLLRVSSEVLVLWGNIGRSQGW